MHEVEVRERQLALQQNLPIPTVSMHMLTGADRRRYNLPQHAEVAAIFTSSDGAPNVPADIVVYPHSDNITTIKYLSPNCDPMSYPLFYPSGEPGWTINIQHNQAHATEKRHTVTLKQFYQFYWAVRNQFNPIHYGCFLTQQKCYRSIRCYQSTSICSISIFDQLYTAYIYPCSEYR